MCNRMFPLMVLLLATFSAGQVLADGWPNGGFLTVVNKSSQDVSIDVVSKPSDDGKYHDKKVVTLGSVRSNHVKQFDDVFRMNGMYGVEIAAGSKPLKTSIQISGPSFLYGRRLVITDRLIEQGGNVRAENITAYDGTWRIYNKKNELFTLNIANRYKAQTLKGSLTVAATGASFGFTGSVDSSGGLVLDFYQGQRMVGKIQAAPDAQTKGRMFGYGETRWFDQNGAEQSVNIPLAFNFVAEGELSRGETNLRGVARVSSGS